MKNLIQFEFRKLTRKKSYYICTVISFALLLMMVLLFNFLLKIAQTDEYKAVDLVLQCLNNGSFTLLAGIFAILFVCEDYTLQTVKNVYARGYSQKNVYLAKLIVTLGAASAMYLALQIFAFLLGAFFFGVGEVESGKYFAVLAVQYVTAMAEVTFAFFLASIFCKSGTSIATFVLSSTMSSLLFGLLDLMFEIEKIDLNDYWVTSFLGDLQSLTVKTDRLLECLFGSLIYIAVFILIGMFGNKRVKL